MQYTNFNVAFCCLPLSSKFKHPAKQYKTIIYNEQNSKSTKNTTLENPVTAKKKKKKIKKKQHRPASRFMVIRNQISIVLAAYKSCYFRSVIEFV